jgi:hypothetical protein
LAVRPTRFSIGEIRSASPTPISEISFIALVMEVRAVIHDAHLCLLKNADLRAGHATPARDRACFPSANLSNPAPTCTWASVNPARLTLWSPGCARSQRSSSLPGRSVERKWKPESGSQDELRCAV